jgi:hypothetical protein
MPPEVTEILKNNETQLKILQILKIISIIFIEFVLFFKIMNSILHMSRYYNKPQTCLSKIFSSFLAFVVQLNVLDDKSTRTALQPSVPQKTVPIDTSYQDNIHASMQEERAYFRALRDIQMLDIVSVVHFSGCYILPNNLTAEGLNFRNILKIFAKKPLFEEIVRERKFKKTFGFYGYNILKLLRHIN